MFGRKARRIKDLETRLERSHCQIQYWMNASASYEIRLLNTMSDNEKLKAENKKLKADNDTSFGYWIGRAIRLRNDCENLKSENKKLKADNNSLIDQLRFWMHESASYEKRLSDIASDNEKLKAENKKLKSDNDVLNDQVLSFRL